jgi:hypothetical protein
VSEPALRAKHINTKTAVQQALLDGLAVTEHLR